MHKIAVDLDGTLATYESGQYPEIGEIIEPVATALRNHLARPDGSAVIFTSRLSGSESRINMKRRIQAWLMMHNLPPLEVTDVKHRSFDEIWDDRAVRIKNNTGEFCKGCKEE